MRYDATKPYTSTILEQIKRTWNQRFVTVTDGPYPIIRRNFIMMAVLDVDHTDGIGTKGEQHWHKRTFGAAVQDALAMNINDLAMARAHPYKLQSHIILPKDDHDAIINIITALANECQKREIAITGGETSIHENQPGMDISITMSGWMERVWPNQFREGQTLIGLPSSGLHANGYTLVRHLCPDLEMDDEWLKPTIIYDTIPNAPLQIPAIQHITGGAFTKLKSKISHQSRVYINRNHKIKPTKVFQQLYERCHEDKLMYESFNCGIGMVLGVNPPSVEYVCTKTGGSVIGNVIEGKGDVTIESMFSDRTITF